MTTPIVPSISDEELADIEKAACRSYGETTTVSKQEIASIIARLRAAEADAKRYRWLRDPDRMPADDPHGHLIVGEADGEDIHWRESLDNVIDAAMERTP